MNSKETADKELLNTPNCPYSWDNSDVSNFTREQADKQLDYCLGCERYYSCNKVAELDDRLCELDGQVKD